MDALGYALARSTADQFRAPRSLHRVVTHGPSLVFALGPAISVRLPETGMDLLELVNPAVL